jgi:hypothetical protein
VRSRPERGPTRLPTAPEQDGSAVRRPRMRPVGSPPKLCLGPPRTQRAERFSDEGPTYCCQSAGNPPGPPGGARPSSPHPSIGSGRFPRGQRPPFARCRRERGSLRRVHCTGPRGRKSAPSWAVPRDHFALRGLGGKELLDGVNPPRPRGRPHPGWGEPQSRRVHVGGEGETVGHS